MTDTGEGRIFKGHDPWYGGDDGTDVLLTIWPSGQMEVALREGFDQTQRRWGPPIELSDASVLRLVRGDVERGRR